MKKTGAELGNTYVTEAVTPDTVDVKDSTKTTGETVGYFEGGQFVTSPPPAHPK